MYDLLSTTGAARLTMGVGEGEGSRGAGECPPLPFPSPALLRAQGVMDPVDVMCSWLELIWGGLIVSTTSTAAPASSGQ